jgi:transcriptional regulator with XRE-family HTH domain
MTGAELRSLRLDLGWTQKQLALMLGVSQPAVSQWESGARPVPIKPPALYRGGADEHPEASRADEVLEFATEDLAELPPEARTAARGPYPRST